MGVYVADSDAEPFCEKAQTTTTRKQSHCPFVLLRQLYREHREKREQQYRQKIDEIRKQTSKNRKMIKRCQGATWQLTTSTEQRREIWVHALDSGSFNIYGFSFIKGHKYKMTRKYSNNRVYRVTHDFSTPQGREEAFKWWDEEYRRQKGALAQSWAKCELWEEIFQEYITQHHYDQRVYLLGGDRVKWLNTKVEILPS